MWEPGDVVARFVDASLVAPDRDRYAPNKNVDWKAEGSHRPENSVVVAVSHELTWLAIEMPNDPIARADGSQKWDSKNRVTDRHENAGYIKNRPRSQLRFE